MRMYSSGSDAHVYEWDLRQLRASARWCVDGALNITRLVCCCCDGMFQRTNVACKAISPNNELLAVGDNVGVVSLFDARVTMSHASVVDDDEAWLVSGVASVTHTPVKTIDVSCVRVHIW
jgi:hypothetical protein